MSAFGYDRNLSPDGYLTFNIDATKTIYLGGLEAYKDALFAIWVYSLNGGPSAATLDVDIDNAVKGDAEIIEGSSGLIANFTQVTEATGLPFTEFEYFVSSATRVLGAQLQVKFTATFTGGSSPYWRLRLRGVFKP